MSPLGLENGAISDAQISASSQWDNNLGPHRARLNGNPTGKGMGAWCALNNDKNQWLQVDLGRYTTVTHIATQGRSDSSQWVTKYSLQYSDDGVNFLWYKDSKDGSIKVQHTHKTIKSDFSGCTLVLLFQSGSLRKSKEPSTYMYMYKNFLHSCLVEILTETPLFTKH